MNKYKLLMIVLFVLTIFCVQKVDASNNTLPLLGKLIYIDPGHGGRDPGALSKTIVEKEYNLKYAKLLMKKLESLGAMVYLTRYEDYDLANKGASLRKRSDLYKRAKIINESKCDLYLSVHLNASTNTSYRGFQIFYDHNNSHNKILGEAITKEVKKITSFTRKVKNVNDYYMYSRITIPGVLIEIGYITNKDDNYLIRQESYQDKMINMISNGIVNYFNNN